VEALVGRTAAGARVVELLEQEALHQPVVAGHGPVVAHEAHGPDTHAVVAVGHVRAEAGDQPDVHVPVQAHEVALAPVEEIGLLVHWHPCR
jgi:hypothetical protein